MRIRHALFALALSATAASGAHAANTVKYDDQPTFVAQGTIDQHTDFDAYDPTVSTVLGSPYTVGVLSLISDQNDVSGFQDSFPQSMRNVVFNDGAMPHAILGTINAIGYDMLSFRMGDLLNGGSATVNLLYENGDFTAFGVTEPLALDGLDFHGFIAPAGHSFVAFNISGNDNFSIVGMTDFEIGHTSDGTHPIGGGCRDTSHPCDTGGGVPEPASWALMTLGFGAVGAAVRRRTAAVA